MPNTSILDEQTQSAAQAAKTAGVAPSTIWRWYAQGRRGIYLEAVRMGKRLYTSKEALERFGQSLAALDRREASSPPPRSRRADRAEREAAEAGL